MASEPTVPKVIALPLMVPFSGSEADGDEMLMVPESAEPDWVHVRLDVPE